LIEQRNPQFRGDVDLLRMHATSLYLHYDVHPNVGSEYLFRAIEELLHITKVPGGQTFNDSRMLIEALREQHKVLEFSGSDPTSIPAQIAEQAVAAQSKLDQLSEGRNWALMQFYRAEAAQLEAEMRDQNGEIVHPVKSTARLELLRKAKEAYELALSPLSSTDPVKASECKEGLAGALSGLAECEGKTARSASYLREARTLFQEVVDSARMNTPDKECAGALENLATAVRSLGELFPEESHNATIEEMRLLESALQIYDEIEEHESAERVRARLTR
jgi:hypothetical protein